MVCPSLLLLKPSCTSKTRDHIACLERRFRLWKAGDINSLVLEGRTIQHRLPHYPSSHPSASHNNQNLSSEFSKLMLAGKTKAALHLLTNSGKGRVLHLDDFVTPGGQTVHNTLISKHPPSQLVSPESLLLDQVPAPLHPIMFESIDSSAIRSAALQIDGAAGPSGLDAYGEDYVPPFMRPNGKIAS